MSEIKRFALRLYNEWGGYSPAMVSPLSLPSPVTRLEYVLASDYDATQSELSALREELASHKYKSELYDEVWPKATGMGFMNITMALAEIPRLQQLLIAAERRNAELEGVLRLIPRRATVYDKQIDAVLKPTESRASE